jgi:hypothetical protein
MFTPEKIREIHILTKATIDINNLFNLGYLSYDNIKNPYFSTCEECGEFKEKDIYCEHCKKDTGTASEPWDILQWWLITDTMYCWLSERGRPVTKTPGGLCLWGRTTCGQSIEQDDIIIQIAKDLTDKIRKDKHAQ